MAKIHFYNEDCFESMRRMQEKGFKFDMVLTSPPYATSRSKVQTQKALDTYNRRYDICLDAMDENEYRDWTIKLFNEFDKCLKENGTILYNISYGSENPNAMWLAIAGILTDTNFMIAEKIVWKKSCALPNNVAHNKLTRICEDVFVFCRKDEYKTFNANKKVKSVREDTGQKYYENVFNYIEAPNNDGANKLNKATYSTKLCEGLLDIYAKKDAIVYDPFMGTGTTAIACEKYSDKMMCVGSELSEAQVEYSKERLNKIREENAL